MGGINENMPSFVKNSSGIQNLLREPVIRNNNKPNFILSRTRKVN
jgi:hypothetical protein